MGVSSRGAGLALLASLGLLACSAPPASGGSRASSYAQDPIEVDPADVGMDAAALQRLDSIVLTGIADGAAPGAALAVGRHGKLVRLRGYGVLDTAETTLVTPRTIYDLASVTKVVGTTSALMMLVDEGRLDLDRRVVDYLPWWSGGHDDKAEVTVGQLLLHRGGLPAFRRWFFDIEGEDAYREVIAAEALEYEPGTQTIYSDIGVMTLAFIVEELSGMRLDAFLEQRLFGPLGMADTGFLPAASLRARIAPTEVDTLWRGEHVRGVVHDENADAIGGVAGHAGLFSTAADLAVFADFMLRRGQAPPCDAEPGSGTPCVEPRAEAVRLIEASTLERFTTRFDDNSSRALGWDTPAGRSSAGDYFSADSFGHTGFTGTSIWMDPELDLFVVLLTNRVNPTRDNSRHVPLRRAVHDAAARAVTDLVVRPRESGGLR